MSVRVPLWVIFCCYAGCLPAEAQQLFVQEYSAEVYKGSSQNWDIGQDAQGILYVANTDGLLTYDGVEWKLVEMPQKAPVRSVAADDVGKVYVGLYGDFGYVERNKAGNFKYHSLGSLLSEAGKSSVGEVSDIKIIGQTVFFGDSLHVYIYHNGSVKVWNGRNNGIVVLSNTAYVVSEGNVFTYGGENFEKVKFPFPGRDIQFLQGYIDNKYIAIDYTDKIWKVDKATGHKQLFSEALRLRFKNNKLYKMSILPKGRIAFLTKQELLIADKDGNVLFTVSNEMLQGSLLADVLFVDAEHNVWFTTDQSIVMIATSSPLSYFDKISGIQGIIYSQIMHNGRLYVGTERAAYCQISKDEFRYMPGTDGGAWKLYSQDGALYVAYQNGILEIKDGVSKRIITASNVETLCKVGDRTGDFIMGTYTSGIWRVQKTKQGWQKRKIKGFDEEPRFMEMDTAGTIWVGHYNTGVWRLKLNEAMDSIEQQKLYSTGQGLPAEIDNSIFKLHDESIIAATNNGLYIYNATRDIFEPDQRFARLLSGIFVYTIAEANNGDIYFRGKNLRANREIAGRIFKTADGKYTLHSTAFNKISWTDTEPSIFATNEGAYISNHNKIVLYNRLQKTYYQNAARPYISTVTAQDSVLYTFGQRTGGITLPYAMNSIRFDYNLASFENSERIEFQYKLEGFDKEWSHRATLRQASFTNLPEGDYTFMLQAHNIYNSESRVATYSFHIDPPIYRTVWAYLLYIVVFGASVYGFAVLNTKRIQWQNELLEKEVNEKTKELLTMNEEIMAQNEEISLINEEVNRKNIEIENQSQVLTHSNATKDKLFSIISHDLRGPVHQLRQILNMMEAGYISTEEFQNRLVPDLRERVGYVASLTDNLLHWARGQMQGIQVKPSVFNLKDVVVENVNLLSAQAANKGVRLSDIVASDLEVYADMDMIRLVLRNLMSNAVKFTPPDGSIEVSANTNLHYVIVSVRDTGMGLSPEDTEMILRKDYFTRTGTAGEKGSGLGLMLCREFIEKNKGTFSIESERGKGSTFLFSVPLHQMV
jgi:signal transduction histidine kinase/ligand-binding sensor domain-containing protein